MFLPELPPAPEPAAAPTPVISAEESHCESTSPEGGRRPSRRARSSINYALPSLRVKMRRETEQFVDAVVVTSERTVEKTDNPFPVAAEKAASEVKIKQEFQDGEREVNMSSIPLAAPTELGKRKRRSSAWYGSDKDDKIATMDTSLRVPQSSLSLLGAADSNAVAGSGNDETDTDNVYDFVDEPVDEKQDKPFLSRPVQGRRSIGGSRRRASVADGKSAGHLTASSTGGKRRRSVAV